VLDDSAVVALGTATGRCSGLELPELVAQQAHLADSVVQLGDVAVEDVADVSAGPLARSRKARISPS
jgi:pantoate kinase